MAEIYCLNDVLGWIFILFPEQSGNLVKVCLHFKSKIKPPPSMASPERCPAPCCIPHSDCWSRTQLIRCFPISFPDWTMTSSRPGTVLYVCNVASRKHSRDWPAVRINAWGDRWTDDQFSAIRMFPVPEKKLRYIHFDYECLALHSSFEKRQGWTPKVGIFFSPQIEEGPWNKCLYNLRARFLFSPQGSHGKR